MFGIPYVAQFSSDTIISLKRIDKFLRAEEVDLEYIKVLPAQLGDSNQALSFENIDFYWKKPVDKKEEEKDKEEKEQNKICCYCLKKRNIKKQTRDSVSYNRKNMIKKRDTASNDLTDPLINKQEEHFIQRNFHLPLHTLSFLLSLSSRLPYMHLSLLLPSSDSSKPMSFLRICYR